MASIANNTYSCASGETIYAGRTGAVPLAIFINSMSPAAWAEYTGTNINERVVYADQPVQADAPFSALESSANLPFTSWANKFAFDPVTKQIGGIGTAQGYSSESPAGTHGKCLIVAVALWVDGGCRQYLWTRRRRTCRGLIPHFGTAQQRPGRNVRVVEYIPPRRAALDGGILFQGEYRVWHLRVTDVRRFTDRAEALAHNPRT